MTNYQTNRGYVTLSVMDVTKRFLYVLFMYATFLSVEVLEKEGNRK